MFHRLPLLLLVCACASAPAPAPEYPSVPAESRATAQAAPEPACPRSKSLEAVSDEVTCLLQRYVRIDTTNPPGNEALAANFLADVLKGEGIEAQVIESASGRGNLYARLKGGGGGKALVLLHHMDVVPADAQTWSIAPFAGEVRDGYLWGRGALDNKGGGVLNLVTFMMLHRMQMPLSRDVIFLGVADEEAGGAQGARWLLEHRPELFADVGFVLNEGGAILDVQGEPAYNVELAQKAPLWLRITAEGKAGHGSSPRPDAATHVLSRVLGRLAAHHFPIRVIPEVAAAFAARAANAPPPMREQLANLEASLKDEAFAKTFLANPRQAALVRNTLSITVLNAGAKENVLPASASAVLDLRLLPGEDAKAITEQVIQVMAEPSLKVETLLSWQGHASPRDTALFWAIEALARQRDPGAPVTANVIGGFTDCSAFRERAIVCYGFYPLRLDFDTLGRLHGKDERISLEALSAAVIDLATLIRTIPSDAKPAPAQ